MTFAQWTVLARLVLLVTLSLGSAGCLAPSGVSISRHTPRARMIPVMPSNACIGAPPARMITFGAVSSIRRSTKGRQIADSSFVGVRLPGGRQ